MKTKANVIRLNIEFFHSVNLSSFRFLRNDNSEWLRIISNSSNLDIVNIEELIDTAKEFCKERVNTMYNSYITIEKGFPVIYLQFY